MMNRGERHGVWESLAEQFLDSETRTDIPRAALVCVDAGLSVPEAADVWRYEVTPAVWPNCWSMAGEWGCWPHDWLVATIEAKRGRWPNRPGLLGFLVYRLRVNFFHGAWHPVARVMRVLASVPPHERAQLTDDLAWLANHFFDSCKKAEPSSLRRADLRRIYETLFLPIFAPLVATDSVSRESPRECRQRVLAALAVPAERSGPYR